MVTTGGRKRCEFTVPMARHYIGVRHKSFRGLPRKRTRESLAQGFGLHDVGKAESEIF